MRSAVVCFLSILSFWCQAQTSYYDQQWKQVDSLIILARLPKSALDLTKKIEQTALKEKNEAQQLKALLYIHSLVESIEDQQDQNIQVQQLKSKIPSLSKAGQAIVHTIIANSYLKQFEKNSNYGRRNTQAQMWVFEQIDSAIQYHLKQAIDIEVTKAVQVSQYAPLIVNRQHLMPGTSLYDLIIQDAIAYYAKELDYSSRNQTNYAAKRALLLLPFDSFAQINAGTKSSTHLEHAITLYQQWMRIHEKDLDKNQFAFINLQRLRWANQLNNSIKHQETYLSSLKDLSAKIPCEVSYQAYYYLAEADISRAERYAQSKDTNYRYAYVEALEKVHTGLQLTKNSTLQQALKGLEERIVKPSIHVTTESVQIPNEPFRVLLSYRNTPTVYTRIIRLAADSYLDTVSDNNNRIQWLHKLPVFQSAKSTLPDLKDYQEHHAELKIDALPLGKYLLICSTDSSFQKNTAAITTNTIWVSSLSFLKNKNDLFILNRSSGQPEKDVQIEIFQYNYEKTKAAKLLKSGKTDANGRYTYTGPFNATLHYRFILRKDTLDMNRMYYSRYFEDPNYKPADDPNKAPAIFYFTDRSIYRPGQTVYVKALLIQQKDNRNPYIDSNYKYITFYLKDVNQKIIDSVKSTITDFGAATAKFQLPEQGLGGNFSIHTSVKNYTAHYFKVEAYKRPSFKIVFNPLPKSYRINDSITFSGTVNAYAGYAINQAQVALTISGGLSEENRMYPNFRRLPEINTTVQTDVNGQFTYQFKIDELTNLNTLGFFTIRATVTDQNGETHSANKSLFIRNKQANLNLDLPSAILTDSALHFTINRINSENKTSNGLTKLVFQKLISPNREIRKRLWRQPDVQLYNEADFTRWFPNDPYRNEDDPNELPYSGDSITHTSITGNERISIDAGSLPAGWYKVIASTIDSFGNYIEQTKNLLVINPIQPNQPVFTNFAAIQNSITAEPGQTVIFTSWSSIQKRFVVRKKWQQTKPTYAFMLAAKGKQELLHLVEDGDRGNVFYNDCFVYQNRFYSTNYSIFVPWSNKKLQVKHESFRDKTTPGSEEIWSITVKNPDSSYALAEVLTALYDASLDEIAPHQWNIPGIWRTYYYGEGFEHEQNFGAVSGEAYPLYFLSKSQFIDINATLASSGIQLMDDAYNNDRKYWYHGLRPSMALVKTELQEMVLTGAARSKSFDVSIRGNSSIKEENYDKVFTKTEIPAPLVQNEPVQVRSNFNETAFFFPQLYTDSTGSVRFSFTMPDALTKWKWQTLAHTKDLSFGMATDFITTAKQLMVQANAPRFLREGDRIEFSTKIINTTEKELSGQVELALIDPYTDRPVDGWFQNSFPNQYFTAGAGQSVVVKFPIQVPVSYTKPLQWKVIASSGNISDGETNYLPVLSNRTLVTETVPLLLRGTETKKYTLDKLIKNESPSLTQEGITISYTTNPIWYAVQALPYLASNSNDCSEQVFNRFNANSMAALIAKQQPAIAAVLEAWKKDSTATKSALEKNTSLKQIVLEETPWVNLAAAETARKRELAVLFDIARMNSEGKISLEKLQQLQLADGAFPWFNGGNANSYITNYILTGLGRLISLKALSKEETVLAAKMIQPALSWMDALMANRYKLGQSRTKGMIWIPAVDELSYLHMRSYFIQQYPVKNGFYQKLLADAKKHWNKQNNYRAALTAQTLFRNGEEIFVRKTILPSLLERTVIDTANASLYWKQRNTYFWYASPIDHQSMMIETLQLLNKNGKLQQPIQQASNWLLLNKQTTDWGNSIATANACYALLLNGEKWLQAQNSVRIQLGNFVLNSDQLSQEAGTGYLQKRIDARFVQPEMGKIQVSSTGKTLSWGSIFWQYFEDMDKITAPANNPLSVAKQFFVERTTQEGKKLLLMQDGDELKIGDKLISRMQINAVRDMDFVHLKDLRPAGTEPENILSGYQWSDRLGYYVSTKDVSSNFYFDRVPKGNHVIEYSMYVTHAGKFSAGLASIQCLYAPEFTSHSKGFTVFVQTAD